MDNVKHNSAAWDKQVEQENEWTIPVSKAEVEAAKNGVLNLLLTPTKPVPQSWLGEVKNKKILCLASGGGQQGPLFAAAGADVTVFDNSPKQLEKDRLTAERENLKLKTVLGDMKDLSVFEDETFDIIFHPVSNCFISEVQPVWDECYRVIKKNGVLLAGFANPLIFIFDITEWEENKKLKIKYKLPYSDVAQLPKEQLEARIKSMKTLDYGHTLEQQINGQIKAGFLIAGLYEDNAGGDLLDEHIDTYIATKAIKL